MNPKPLLKILFGFVLFTFIGIKYEPEFNDPEFFIKHRPTLTVNYFSPVGDSDLTLEDLTGEVKSRELAYQEFVGNYYERDFVDYFSIFFVALMSFMILSGIGQLTRILNTKPTWGQSLLGYSSHVVLLFLALAAYWNAKVDGYVLSGMYWVFSFLCLILINRWKKPRPQH